MTEYLLVIVLGIIALGAVAFPLIAGRNRYDDLDQLDADVERYRNALAHGTVCPRCRHANTVDADYCADCGRELSD
jgi:hypothetical protein